MNQFSWNITHNPQYINYSFNYSWLEKMANLIETYYVGLLDKGIIKPNLNTLFNKAPRILSVVFDLLVNADKSLTENNEVAFISSMATANEYILKYAIIEIEYKDDKDSKNFLEKFHDWENIELWKLSKKVKSLLPNKLREALQINLNNESSLINDFKHLNNLSVIEFHIATASGSNKLMDGSGQIDNNAYHFGVMEDFQKSLDISFFAIFFAKGITYSYFTSSDYVDAIEVGEIPEPDSQYFPAPWFEKYIHDSYPKLENLFFKDGYVIQRKI